MILFPMRPHVLVPVRKTGDLHGMIRQLNIRVGFKTMMAKGGFVRTPVIIPDVLHLPAIWAGAMNLFCPALFASNLH